ncbi:TetR/AcrR family transcriptional regulator [Clostridium akagii]|uniref:TetR/AcrR family transcriptional regulator n=1 Tax=Clostridium akagii TaxID=91623 RepID=UPI00047AA41C|nr:TetR/AcrR family transcriptional regulator [Clostridium akagii]
MARENKREAILAAAIKIFAQKSYNGTTTSEIAKEAGVAEGTIFRYFKTKKDILIKGVIDKFTEFVGEKFISEQLTNILEKNSDKDGREILKILIKDRIELVKKYKDIMKVVVSESLYNAEVATSIKKNILPKAKLFIRKFLTTYIEKGVFRNVDLDVAETALMGTVTAYVVQNLFLKQSYISNEEEIDKLIDIIIGGLKKS